MTTRIKAIAPDLSGFTRLKIMQRMYDVDVIEMWFCFLVY